MDTRKILFVVAGVLLLAVAVWYGLGLFSSPRKVTPQQLAETALSPSASPEKRVEAAAELAPMATPVAVKEMTRVYQQSPDPEVKAVVIQGMAGNWDFDSMETFLAAMDDESLLVRTRAHGAVQRLLQIDAGYRPDASREERLAKIKIYRDDWEKMRVSPGLKKFREKLKQESEMANGPG